MSSPTTPPPFATALLAGGMAGTTVDLSLYPLDTLKTRLQSRAGFFPSGGFSGIYRGVGSALVGSSPGAALFFCTYEGTKSVLAGLPGGQRSSASSSSSSSASPSATRQAAEHMLAGSLGEVAACSVRVPTEVVKQRAQAGQHSGSSLQALRSILDLGRAGGAGGVARVWRELYRGWGITVMREVPFTIIQFPLWERLKAYGRARRARRRRRDGVQGAVAIGAGAGAGIGAATPPPEPGAAAPRSSSSSVSSVSSAPADLDPDTAAAADVPAFESALYGSLAGAIAAATTTPLDVLKTRIMLSERRVSSAAVVRSVLREEGWRAFFAGTVPRVTWISVGGAIFLGSYQFVVNSARGGVA